MTRQDTRTSPRATAGGRTPELTPLRRRVLEIVAESGGMLGFEVTEVNPLLDAHNGTAEMLTELALSAFGKSIL